MSLALRVSHLRRILVGIKIAVGENESIQEALRRFRQELKGKGSRSWYKTRAGYFEKPSIRKRRKRRIATINQKSGPNMRPLKMKMGLNWLLLRKRPWP